MNTNTNFYQENDYKYSEIGIALTDFIYGSTVQISIPIITPFMDNSNVINNKERISKVNILNADVNALGINNNNECEVRNCMDLYVPHYLADFKRTPVLHSFSAHGGEYHPAVPHTDMVQYDWNGKKGTKFIVLFLGGDNSNPQIIGRVH